MSTAAVLLRSGRDRQRLDARRDNAARNTLAEANRQLVSWAVNRWAPRLNEHDREDVVQAAWFGLLRAAELYDESLGNFSTYASAWLRQAIGRALKKRGLIALPDNLAGRQRAAAVRRTAPVPLDGLLALRDPDAVQPVEAAGRTDLVEYVLRTMTPKQRRAVRLYFHGLTFEQVGRRMGVCRQAAQRLVGSGLARAREALAS